MQQRNYAGPTLLQFVVVARTFDKRGIMPPWGGELTVEPALAADRPMRDGDRDGKWSSSEQRCTVVAVRDLVRAAEQHVRLQPSADEQFSGWGLMGLTFRSGDVLATRRFPATSVGAGYTSVWHRDPHGDWTFYADTDPSLSCSRYFGSALVRSITCPIVMEWTGDSHLHIEVPERGLSCDLTVGSTWASRVMNLMSSAFPEWAWRDPRALSIAAAVAGPLLGAGTLAMAGAVPNRQWFIANPRKLWTVQAVRLSIHGRETSEMGAVHPQARLGDFYIPQRGLLAIGNASFEAFDPERHSPRTSSL